jgi:hypothetical protein
MEIRHLIDTKRLNVKKAKTTVSKKKVINRWA